MPRMVRFTSASARLVVGRMYVDCGRQSYQWRHTRRLLGRNGEHRFIHFAEHVWF